MKVAIVGSRDIVIHNFAEYITKDDELVSGGAVGIDQCVAEYAKRNGIKITEITPDYFRFGRAAPIIRNRQIVDMADRIVVFWNGNSKGSLSVIQHAEKTGKPCRIVLCK